jgi:hypothetical protein
VGSTGATGAQGFTGATGTKGATGATGATGSQGFTGATGLGSTGATGAQGLTGATGRGATGATGATGSQGPVGATGLTGATGQDGLGLLAKQYKVLGSAFTNVGTYTWQYDVTFAAAFPNTNYSVDVTIGAPGATGNYLAGQITPASDGGYLNAAYISNKTTSGFRVTIADQSFTSSLEIWIRAVANGEAGVVPLNGATGATGPIGATGAGLTGATGSGATGLTGATGPAPTQFTVNTVTQAATVTFDLATASGQWHTLNLSSATNLVLATSNRAAGRYLLLEVTNTSGTTRTISYGISPVGTPVPPSSLSTGETAVLRLECWGTATADVYWIGYKVA